MATDRSESACSETGSLDQLLRQAGVPQVSETDVARLRRAVGTRLHRQRRSAAGHRRRATLGGLLAACAAVAVLGLVASGSGVVGAGSGPAAEPVMFTMELKQDGTVRFDFPDDRRTHRIVKSFQPDGTHRGPAIRARGVHRDEVSKTPAPGTAVFYRVE